MKLHLLIKDISNKIFEHEDKRLKNRQLQLVNENHSNGGSSDGFRHNGVIFTNLQSNLISRGKFKAAEAVMVPAVNMYLEDFNMVGYDKLRINQALTLVLKDIKSSQDMRDALPECLVDVLLPGRDASRTRPEAYTLADNPRSYNQYMQLREKIEFYLASKMLY